VLELGCADAAVSFDDAGIDASVAGLGGGVGHIGHVPTLVGAPVSCRRRIPVIRRRIGLGARWRGGGRSGLMGRGDER
jgi:hypothetical protein